ncbi:MAG TPA: hypothetical protein VHZ78_08240 [Rhizomicrobium sp.]|jgi:hypothetical protein|nr:hypothetical protein [Rhizomicrobium sp.]
MPFAEDFAVSLPAVPERRVRVATVKSSARMPRESTRNRSSASAQKIAIRSLPCDKHRIFRTRKIALGMRRIGISAYAASLPNHRAKACFSVRFRTEKTVGFRAQMLKF